MSECYLEGMQWGIYPESFHCIPRPSGSCKICGSHVCIMHSVDCCGLICEPCVLSLPEKTNGDILGKDWFENKTIKRIERNYLTTTKACKQ